MCSFDFYVQRSVSIVRHMLCDECIDSKLKSMAVCLFRDVVEKTDHGRINTLYIDHVYTSAGLFIMDWKLYTFFIPHRQAQMSMHFCRDNTIHVTFSHSPNLLGVTGLRHSRLVKDWQRKRSMLQ